jgi:hypothetical protein
MSDEPVMTLEYAQDELLSWRTVARAVAILILVYAGARLLAALINMASFLIFQRGSGFPFWAYSIDSIATAVPLIGVVIAAWAYASGATGRKAMIWTLASYLIIKGGMVVLALVTAELLHRSRNTVGGNYVFVSYVSQAFFTAADCVWPAAGIWFFTRPALRRFS